MSRQILMLKHKWDQILFFVSSFSLGKLKSQLCALLPHIVFRFHTCVHIRISIPKLIIQTSPFFFQAFLKTYI